MRNCDDYWKFDEMKHECVFWKTRDAYFTEI